MNNKLEKFHFGNLKAMEHLDLDYNKLTSLPDAVLKLPSLDRLDVRGNPWNYPFETVLRKAYRYTGIPNQRHVLIEYEDWINDLLTKDDIRVILRASNHLQNNDI